MSETRTYCPFLGLAADQTLLRNSADTAHRCYALQPLGTPDVHYQSNFCLAARHVQCPFYQSAQASAGAVAGAAAGASPRGPSVVLAPRPVPASRSPRWLPLVVWGVLALVAIVVAFVYLRDAGVFALGSASQVSAATTSPSRPATLEPTNAATPLPAAAEVALASAAVPTSVPTRIRYNTPTPEAGGRILALTSKAGDAGWWTGAEARGNHLGDSFLYAGYTIEQPFISAARFSLGSVPRGAPIRAAELRLTGLNKDRFDANAGGTWTVSLLPAAALPGYAHTDFQTLLNAPAGVTLFPTFFAADLDAGRTNVASLDEAGRAWLEAQIRDGATDVIARIVGPGGGDTLFAWDAGAGPGTTGQGPQLLLALGPAPATAPALPTEVVIVATDTPTPANVLTAAADAAGATATAAEGTPAFRYVTPTPSPANIATLQALALKENRTPIVADTPTPANEATAEMQGRIATAQAFLTGTPTPQHSGFVTPVIITPTPQPANVMTAAAYALTATAAAPAGTPTPWGYNVIVATITPPLFVIVDTPTPANEATATIRAAYATAVAVLTGTFTPFPYNAVTATPTPTPTETPLPVTATPTVTPSRRAPTPRAATTPARGATGRACPDPRVQITAPKAQAAVSRQLEVRGRAVHEAFAGYVVEFARGALPASGYEEAFRSETPVENGVLGNFVLTALQNGTYTLSLRVLTSAGDPPPPCRLVFQVRNK